MNLHVCYCSYLLAVKTILSPLHVAWFVCSCVKVNTFNQCNDKSTYRPYVMLYLKLRKASHQLQVEYLMNFAHISWPAELIMI